MSNIPADLRDAKTHEWARLDDDGSITVGIDIECRIHTGLVTAQGGMCPWGGAQGEIRFMDVETFLVRAIVLNFQHVARRCGLVGVSDGGKRRIGTDPQGRGRCLASEQSERKETGPDPGMCAVHVPSRFKEPLADLDSYRSARLSLHRARASHLVDGYHGSDGASEAQVSSHHISSVPYPCFSYCIPCRVHGQQP